MAFLVSTLIFLFVSLSDATPGIYFSSEGCGAPKLDASYMGDNVVGDNLELLINEKSLEDFNEVGFEYGKEYEIMVRTKDEEWMQYVVHSSHGKATSSMGEHECDGKLSLFPMDFASADLTWTAPTKEEMDNDNQFGGNVIFTTSYAPAFVNAFIQEFTLKSAATAKPEL